jgi:hypothetical protein
MLKVFLLSSVIALVAIMVPLSTVSHGIWDRVRSQPIDATEVRQHLGIRVPTRLVSWIKTDALAFGVHSTLASLIERNHGDPAAYGVQWLKASAHAKTSAEIGQTSAGLLRAKQQSANATSFQTTICSFVEGGYYTGHQREVIASAGLSCRRSV